MSVKELSDLVFPPTALSHVEDQVDQRVVARLDSHAASIEEHQRGGEPGPLVPIHERMVLHDVKQVRCSDLKVVRVQRLAKPARATATAEARRPASRISGLPPYRAI